MPRSSTELYAIAKQAQDWLLKRGLDPDGMPYWTGFPEWPDPNAPTLPVWRIPTTRLDIRMGTDAIVRCGALRMAHDPDERSPWVFIPGEDDDVWLALTSRISASN